MAIRVVFVLVRHVFVDFRGKLITRYIFRNKEVLHSELVKRQNKTEHNKYICSTNVLHTATVVTLVTLTVVITLTGLTPLD